MFSIMHCACHDARRESCRLFQRFAAEDVISWGLGKRRAIGFCGSAADIQHRLFVCVKTALAFEMER